MQSSTEPGILPVSSEEDPNTTEYQPISAAEGIQDLPGGDYEEGQFVSFGATPSFPGYGGQLLSEQTVPSLQQQYNQQAAEENMDDLGMGNSSLRKEKPNAAVVSAEGNTGASNHQQPTDSSTQQTDEAGSSWWSKNFGGERHESLNPVNANLGAEQRVNKNA
ncbi:hypothetical protein BGZ65_012824, partial [Modicella reniformis]